MDQRTIHEITRNDTKKQTNKPGYVLSCSVLLITDKLCPSQKASFPALQCRKEIEVKGLSHGNQSRLVGDTRLSGMQGKGGIKT